jgi:hypothetical protein
VVNLEQASQGSDERRRGDEQVRESHFVVRDKLYTQKYDQRVKRFFDFVYRKIPIEDLGYTHKLILRQDGRVDYKNFSNYEIEMTDRFNFDRSRRTSPRKDILSGSAVRKKKESVLVKIPVINVDIEKEWDLIVEDQKTGERTHLYVSPQLRSKIDKFQIPREIGKRAGRSSSIFNRSLIKTVHAVTFSEIFELVTELNVSGHQNDPDDLSRFNVTFVMFGIPKAGLEELAAEYADSLFTRIPLNESKESFNFWYVDNVYPTVAPWFDPHLNDYRCVCRLDLEPHSYGLPNPLIVNICSSESHCRSSAIFNGKEMKLRYYEKQYKKDKSFYHAVFHHEMGHIVGLRDEYVKNLSVLKVPYPNCPETRQIGDNWWGDIFPDINCNKKCYKGCSTSANYRFYKNSPMNSCVECPFENIHRFTFCASLFQRTGRMQGDYCNAFLDQFPDHFYRDEVCYDRIDNDGNGLIDCEDTACLPVPALWPPNVLFEQSCAVVGSEYSARCHEGECVESSCKDGLDNDYDWKTDCADEDCLFTICGYEGLAGELRCQHDGECKKSETNCNNVTTGGVEVDDDGDGKANCADVDCVYQKGPLDEKCEPYGETSCSDTHDNDGDGFVDCGDEDCYDTADCGLPPDCQNEVECVAPWSSTGSTMVNYEKITCYNRVDDEGDGKVDCMDMDCWQLPIKDNVFDTKIAGYLGDDYPCQSYLWQYRALIKEEGSAGQEGLYYNTSGELGNDICMHYKAPYQYCDHIEVKSSSAPDSWLDVSFDSAFLGIGCHSTMKDYQNLPWTADNYAFSAICKANCPYMETYCANGWWPDIEFSHYASKTCHNFLDDDKDGYIDCMDFDCRKENFPLVDQQLPDTYQCQEYIWKNRVLLKQEGPAIVGALAQGKFLCSNNNDLFCHHLEVKLSNTPDSWTKISTIPGFEGVGCLSSTPPDYENVPPDLKERPISAICSKEPNPTKSEEPWQDGGE